MKLVVCIALVGVLVAAAKQQYRVKGKLMCGDAPLANAQIQLYDEDTGMCDCRDDGGSYLTQARRTK